MNNIKDILAKNQRFQIVNFGVITLLLLISSLSSASQKYGSNHSSSQFSNFSLGLPKYKQKQISEEEALKIRTDRGELLIPSDKFACCRAVVISYLACSHSEHYYNKRLKILRNANNLILSRLSKNHISIAWEDAMRYYKKERNKAAYLTFLRNQNQEMLLKDFCKNITIKPENIHTNLQKIANKLKVAIESYEPLKEDPHKLKILKIYSPDIISSARVKGSPIRIVRDTYIKNEEKNQYLNNRLLQYHYRALLNNPFKWEYKSLKQNYSPIVSYNPQVVEQKIEAKQRELLVKFGILQEEIKSMLEDTLKDILKSVSNYNTDELKSAMNIYQTADQSGLITILNEYLEKPVNSLEKVKIDINKASISVKKQVEKVNFATKEYHKKTKNEKKKWFSGFNTKMELVSFADENQYNNKPIGKTIEKTMINKIKDAKNMVDKVFKKDTLEERDCEQLNSFLQTVNLFSECVDVEALSDAKKLSTEYKKESSSNLDEKIVEVKKKGVANIDKQDQLAHNLIELKTIEKHIDKVHVQEVNLDESIEIILKKFKKENGDSSGIKLNQLATKLRSYPVGAQLVAETGTFKGISIMLRNTKFASISYKDILNADKIKEYKAKDNSKTESIVKSNIDQKYLDKMEEKYKEFEDQYWKLIEDNLGNEEAVNMIVAIIKKKYTYKEQVPGKVNWKNSIRQEIPTILAHIFAFWTLKNAKFYKDAKGIGDQDRRKYLLQPHAAQTIAIMRMLGLDEGKLKNHLVQIGTGEGKSVVSFATATTLALLGFEVSCVCYSEYLSLRDQKSFMPLIGEMGMSEHVHYTTFNKLCEDMINEKGAVRDQVVNFIKDTSGLDLEEAGDEIIYLSDDQKDNNSDDDTISPLVKNVLKSNKKPKKKRAKVIFIDEVDVFFNKDFYGSPYSPTALLQHASITDLIQFVWNNRKNSLTYNKVKSSDPYKKCADTFKKWKPIIDESVKNMVADVRQFDQPQYVISNGKLCYKDGDSVSSKITYKYKTTFAALNEKQKITPENLKGKLGLYFNCGMFSYAEIPHSFDLILGVTGTLEKLSSVELEIIEGGYNIKQHTYMPSLYGDSKRKFLKNSSKGLKIIENEHYNSFLKKEIIEYLQGVSLTSESKNNNPDHQNLTNKRATIVFFETAKKLDEFYNASIMAPLKEDINIMKSDLSYEEKDRRVAEAVTAGTITFSIREFGRGTDFVCYDTTVNQYGGVHVIVTFFPENISEETQLVGRTARQGNDGSVSIVLKQSAIEGLITTKEIENTRTQSEDFYTLLNKRRNQLFASNYKEAIKYVGELREEHKIANIFLENLWKGNVEEVKKHLLKYNVAPSCDPTRTIILVDATGSMGELLSKTQKTIATMFFRINEVLKKRGKLNAFSLQFVAYRNYGAPPSMILQISSWESRPENLLQFMKNVHPNYGWGNEAVEIGLAHAWREHSKEPIDQVIVIGDAPPNTKDEVAYKRKHSSIKWEDQGAFYSTPTYYQDQIQKFKQDKIPVHAFHVPVNGSSTSYPETERVFNEIAKETAGHCELLNISSDKGADQLTSIVSKQVLFKTDGQGAVDDYNKMFGGKSYL